MTSNFQINPENQPLGTGETVSGGTTVKNSRSAVPIFVYQQLVENLHQAEADLAKTKQINQELVTQNQQLRQEIITILQTVEQVQQNVKSLIIPQLSTVQNTSLSHQFSQQSTILQKPDLPVNEQESGFISEVEHGGQEESNVPVIVPSNPKIKSETSTMVKVKKKRPKPPVKKEKLEIKKHQEESDLEENANTLNGWLLFLAILLIVITAFGAGFVVMRPLLNPNPSNPSVPNR